MSTYTCYHCGKKLNLVKAPSKDRKCPKCGRKLHVCQNCQFFDVSGCVLLDGQLFTAAHGALCSKFQFRALAA